MKKLFLFLILALCLPMTSQPVMADDENPAIEKEVKVYVDEIKLRSPLEIEQAVMEYMLAFEAYQSARKSSDPEVRGKMVQYMKQYREAYARFLDMMREDNLYEPQKPKNPAGRYNRKHMKQKGSKRQWRATAARQTREKVKKMVEAGASPEAIKATIKESLPAAPMSVDPMDAAGLGQSPAGGPGTGFTRPGDDDDDDDKTTSKTGSNLDSKIPYKPKPIDGPSGSHHPHKPKH